MSGKYGEEKTLNKKRHLWLGAALGCVILLLGVGRAWEDTYTIRVDTTGLQWSISGSEIRCRRITTEVLSSMSSKRIATVKPVLLWGGLSIWRLKRFLLKTLMTGRYTAMEKAG